MYWNQWNVIRLSILNGLIIEYGYGKTIVVRTMLNVWVISSGPSRQKCTQYTKLFDEVKVSLLPTRNLLMFTDQKLSIK